MIKAIVWGFASAALALLVWVGFHMIPASGAFREMTPVLVDQCRRIDVAPGTEDIEIDESRNVAFVSTADRRAWYLNQGGARPSGAIYLLDLANLDTPPALISGDAPADFSPHGISLYSGDDGERRLFVVNHPSDGREVVEIFDILDDNTLAHAESVSFPDMYSPNDVVGVGPSQFYATNDRRHDKGLMGALETYLALPLTSVVYFDGERGRTVASGMTYANGVNVSPDGASVYVAEVLKRRLVQFDRDPASGALTAKRKLPVGTAPDNIDVAPNGDLWVAGHPKVFDFVEHAEDETHIAPSEIVRMSVSDMRRQIEFLDASGFINASSVGASNGDVLIVGAVFDGHVAVCPLR